MATYIDSSILLAALLDQPGRDALISWWDQDADRVSSALLEAECVTVIRRAAALQPAPSLARFLEERLALLDRYLAGVTLKHVDAGVLGRLRKENRLDRCRTLDAIHLATALLFRDHTDEGITVCSLDERLRETAAAWGVPVAP